MSQTFRLPEIIEIARRDRKVTVEALADHFGVTLQTIRRDLAELADAGKLERVHGGAVLPSRTTNLDYEERRGLNAAAKICIARACAAEIPEDCSVFLAIGTTTEAVALELRDRRSLLVVTNNVKIADILTDAPGVRVIVTGGLLRQSDGGLVGDIAAATVRQFRFDIGVIGCSALDAGGDVLDYDLQEVGVSQTILRQSERRFLVADRSKFDRRAPARVATLAEIDTVFIDAPLPRSLEARCRGWNTEIRTCPEPA